MSHLAGPKEGLSVITLQSFRCSRHTGASPVRALPSPGSSDGKGGCGARGTGAADLGCSLKRLRFDWVTAMIGIFLIEMLSPGGELIFNQLVPQCW